MEEELKKLMDENETILIRIKPNKMAFMIRQSAVFVFNLILILAIFFIMAIIARETDGRVKSFNELIGFYTILFCIYAVLLGFSIMYLLKLHKNTFYMVTNKAIYISKGVVNNFFIKIYLQKSQNYH